MGKQEKSHNTDGFDNWLIWLKRAAYLGITVFLSVLISYFVNFAQWPWRLSPLPQDWSAFGSLLAGAASFLAAIGTVGVLLISIKQFKVQQEQIKQQAKRQDDFEARQQEKWDKENEMLNFQKYKMHIEAFEKTLINIENRSKNTLKFHSPITLYRKIFKKNSDKSVMTTLKQNITHEESLLHIKINDYNQLVHSLNSINHRNELFTLLYRTNRQVDLLDAWYSPVSDAGIFIFDETYELNFGVFTLLSFLHQLEESFRIIAEFSDYQLNEKFEKLQMNSIFNIIDLVVNHQTEKQPIKLKSPFPGFCQLLKLVVWHDNHHEVIGNVIRQISYIECLQTNLEKFSDDKYTSQFMLEVRDIIKKLKPNSDPQIDILENLLDSFEAEYNKKFISSFWANES